MTDFEIDTACDGLWVTTGPATEVVTESTTGATWRDNARIAGAATADGPIPAGTVVRIRARSTARFHGAWYAFFIGALADLDDVRNGRALPGAR